MSYNEDHGIILTWSGKADPTTPEYPFNTSVTDFFSLLYDTDFWKNGSMKNNTNFEFDSRCPDSKYIPAIFEAIEKLDNSLLQQPDCTWAYLGSGKDGQEAKRYLFWTSLNTDKVGAGKSIPVIIQTGDGKYYVSETTTGKRNGKNYVTISESLTPNQYTQTLKKEKNIPPWKQPTMPISRPWSNMIRFASLKVLCPAISADAGKRRISNRSC